MIISSGMKICKNKSTLKLYRKFKFSILDEQKLYDNTAASTTPLEVEPSD